MSIQKHKFTDRSINIDGVWDDLLEIEFDSEVSPYFHIKKVDAIALAKHFKLTADDIS